MCDKFLLLVNTIKRYPCLYNQNVPEYLKKDVTEKAWVEIATLCQLSVYECKEKWRNLRYSLIRSLKPNPDGTTKKKYYLHDEMEFIVPFIRSKSGVLTTEEDTDDENLLLHEPEVEQSTLGEFDFFATVEPPTKKRKIDNTTSNKSINNNDEACRKMFLLSLMPEVNALTEYQMKIFRRKVFLLLDNITEQNDDNSEINETETIIKTEPL